MHRDVLGFVSVWRGLLAIALSLILAACGERYERTPLATTAPSTVSLAVGAAQEYAISGGKSPYSVSSSDGSVAVAAVSGSKLTVGAVAGGSATITVKDADGAETTIAIQVESPTLRPLSTAAPSSVTIAPGASGAQSYSIFGGVAPYVTSSSNTTVASAAVVDGAVKITGVAAGSANVLLRDNAGTVVNIGVTVLAVSSGTAPPVLYTTAPASVTVAMGVTPVYAIGGGVAPYSVQTSDTRIATATVAGSALTVTGIGAGNASLQIRDAAGASVTVQVTVPTASALPLYSTAPARVTIGTGMTPEYTVGGGTGPYTVTSSNTLAATAQLSGNVLQVTGVYPGLAEIVLRDAAGTLLSISVTVPSALAGPLFTTAPASTTVGIGSTTVYRVGGGTPPYAAVSSNTAIASANLDGADLTVSGVAAGNASIELIDATGTRVALALAVTSLPLVVSPNDATGVVNDLLVATVAGGTPPYRASVGNRDVATATMVSQSQLEITLKQTGSTVVTVLDADGQTAPYSITVNAATPGIRLSPDTVAISENDNQPIRFTVFGAAPGAIQLFSSDVTVLQPSISGTAVTVSTGTKGDRCVAGLINEIYPVTITAVDSVRAVGVATINIANSQAGCP